MNQPEDHPDGRASNSRVFCAGSHEETGVSLLSETCDITRISRILATLKGLGGRTTYKNCIIC